MASPCCFSLSVPSQDHATWFRKKRIVTLQQPTHCGCLASRPKHPPPECQQPSIRHLRRCMAAPTTTANTTRSVTERALCWERRCWIAAIYHVQEPASLVIRWLLLPKLSGSRKAYIVAGSFQMRHVAQKPETPLITKVRLLATCQTGNGAAGSRRKHPRVRDLRRRINRKPPAEARRW